MKQNIFNNIRYYREKQGISLKEFSRITNLSQGYLSHLERGNRINPSFNTMSKISLALNLNISNIFNI